MDATPPFTECHEVGDDRPIRQGDVFQWLTPSSDPWAQFGVVITADCDIAHEKHRGILSYVPVLLFTEYLAQFYLPRKLETALTAVRAQLNKQIRAYQQQNLSAFTEPVSDAAALGWVRSVPAQQIADQLGVPQGKTRDKFIALADDYLLSDQALHDGTFKALLDAVLRLRSRQNADKSKLYTALWREIDEYATHLPSDAFFIRSLSHNNMGGYVAYLRLVREISHKHIATRYTDLRDSAVIARRISHLGSPYIYSLTQQLATVFSAIGLPTEYEDSRRQLVEQVANNIQSLGQQS